MKSQPSRSSCEQSRGARELRRGRRNFEHLEQQAAPRRLQPRQIRAALPTQKKKQKTLHCLFLKQLVKEQEVGHGSRVIHRLNNKRKRGRKVRIGEKWTSERVKKAKCGAGRKHTEVLPFTYRKPHTMKCDVGEEMNENLK